MGIESIHLAGNIDLYTLYKILIVSRELSSPQAIRFRFRFFKLKRMEAFEGIIRS